MHSCLVSGILALIMVLQNQVSCDSSSPSGEDASASIPLLASGKRQHSIMRFGKRPAGGHNLIHFGKRDDVSPNPLSTPLHSILYLGKRESDVPDLWDYLQKNGDGSYKRGHSIMRFGKRVPENHNFIRFGRNQDEEEEDAEKRSGNNNGHSMMYFGKRGSNTGHSMMYFGKRGNPNGHSMMYFGKRDPSAEDYDEGFSGKRAHAMIHFGKREDGSDGNRGRSHAMIHFGKRDSNEEDDLDTLYLNPELLEVKRQHNLLRFGKKMDRKGSHAMIHFGKRDLDGDKRAHAMIHFGKRSVDGDVQGNQSMKGSQTRAKREAEQPPEPLVTLINYEDPEDGIPIDASPKFAAAYSPDDPWARPYEEELESRYAEYQPDKKDTSKNVFLRFG